MVFGGDKTGKISRGVGGWEERGVLEEGYRQEREVECAQVARAALMHATGKHHSECPFQARALKRVLKSRDSGWVLAHGRGQENKRARKQERAG